MTIGATARRSNARDRLPPLEVYLASPDLHGETGPLLVHDGLAGVRRAGQAGEHRALGGVERERERAFRVFGGEALVAAADVAFDADVGPAVEADADRRRQAGAGDVEPAAGEVEGRPRVPQRGGLRL